MRSFEEALLLATQYSYDSNVYEGYNGEYHWSTNTSKSAVEKFEQFFGWKLRATVRYEQKVEIL